MAGDAVYTIGHSTRTLEELVGILLEAGVRELVDVRTVPRSRRHPQFERDALAAALPERGVGYRHEQALGGFRRPRPGSPNGAGTTRRSRATPTTWPTPTSPARSLASAAGHALAEQVTTVMCAEAQWWRCHRRLIADALTVRGRRVLHLGLGSQPVEHELTSFAVRGPAHALTYPPAQGELWR